MHGKPVGMRETGVGGGGERDVCGDARPPRLDQMLSDLAFPHGRADVPIQPIAGTTAAVGLESPIPIARNIARDGIAIGWLPRDRV